MHHDHRDAEDNEPRAALGLRLTVLADPGAGAEAAIRATATNLAHLCDRAGLLYDERLGAGLARHAADVRRAPRAAVGRLAVPPQLRRPHGADALPAGERGAELAEAVLAAVLPGVRTPEAVTEALRLLAHLADWMGADAAAALDIDVTDAHPRAARNPARHPDPDPVLVRLARRASELEATADTLAAAPAASWAWATPGCTAGRSEPLYAERLGVPAGTLLPERPAGEETDEIGFDGRGRVVAVRAWRIGALGEPRPLAERLWWPAGDGIREMAALDHGRLVAAGRERDDEHGRLAEVWELASVRHWARERYAYDGEGRLARVQRVWSVGTPGRETAHPRRTVWDLA